MKVMIYMSAAVALLSPQHIVWPIKGMRSKDFSLCYLPSPRLSFPLLLLLLREVLSTPCNFSYSTNDTQSMYSSHTKLRIKLLIGSIMEIEAQPFLRMKRLRNIAVSWKSNILKTVSYDRGL